MENFINAAVHTGVSVGAKLLGALALWLVGPWA